MKIYCSYIGGGPRGSPSSSLSPDEAPPSRLSGSGLEKEVQLKGGASGLRANEGKAVWICDESAEVESAIGSRKNCMRVFAIVFS